MNAASFWRRVLRKAARKYVEEPIFAGRPEAIGLCGTTRERGLLPPIRRDGKESSLMGTLYMGK